MNKNQLRRKLRTREYLSIEYNCQWSTSFYIFQKQAFQTSQAKERFERNNDNCWNLLNLSILEDSADDFDILAQSFLTEIFFYLSHKHRSINGCI